MQEITGPLQSLPEDPVATVHADFPVALRGYDRLAVDAYVQKTSQLVAELQATRSPEAAVRKALERVGEQISGILQRAHSTAEEITTQSRREGEERLEQARIEAAEIIGAAHERVKELDADTDRIWLERHRIVDDARELAHQLTALADAAAARFPESDDATEPFVQDEGASKGAVEPGTGAADDQAHAQSPFDVDSVREAEDQSPADPGEGARWHSNTAAGSAADHDPGPAVPPPAPAAEPSDDQ